MIQRQPEQTISSIPTEKLYLPTLITVMAIAFGAALAVPTSAAAGTLYRWTEPDGALTFSPTPPSDGRSFEEVDPKTMKPRSAAAPSPARPATQKAARASTPQTDARPSTAPIATPVARVERTVPSIAAATIERSTPVTTVPAIRVDKPRIVVRAPAPERTPAVSPAATPASQKQARCNDLRKRVTSLERRLATPLSAEDMDNTIVHMARYQNSFNSHCG